MNSRGSFVGIVKGKNENGNNQKKIYIITVIKTIIIVIKQSITLSRLFRISVYNHVWAPPFQFQAYHVLDCLLVTTSIRGSNT